MIFVDFHCPETERIWHGAISRKLPHDIQRTALRKLRLMNAARALSDLAIPPNNRLEALSGNRKDEYSIRINDQWRICFIWTKGGPAHVEFIDDH